jgi:hypothetical protein
MVSIEDRYSYSRCQFLVFDRSPSVSSRLERFLDLANSLTIPVTRCPSEIVDKSLLENLAKGLRFNFKAEIDCRNMLFLCGGHLEEQISFSAHFLLETGFDTRLIRDMISVRDAEHTQFHDQRLIHSGALPLTSKQLVYEWIATETNLSVRVNLQNYLEWTD